MKKSICVIFALLLCLALLPAVAMAADSDDSWIEEKLREIEENYNPDIMLLSFVEGHIPWTTRTDENPNGRQYFTVSGLPETISKEAWLAACAAVSPQGYNVDNTGVKYTKFPQYDNDGYHFASVTVNDVEVVRMGILVPDDNPNGEPVYYYMTQKHVDSDDTSDGSGSHTGSISALLLPNDAQFTVNYAVNEYELSYEVQLLNPDTKKYDTVTADTFEGTGDTWEYTIFSGQNPASTTSGKASFTVNIPYGYTATVHMVRDGYQDEMDLTGERTDLPEEERAEKVVNDGYPLGMEPGYVNVKVGDSDIIQHDANSPTVKRMRAVFYSDLVQENRHIIVRLTKDTKKPVFDAHYWLKTANAGTRGGVVINIPFNSDPAKGLNEALRENWGFKYEPHLNLTKHGNGNAEPEDGYNWSTSIFKDDPQTLTGNTQYNSHWYTEDDVTWNLVWAFQTNDSDRFILNSLELNGVHINIPFKPMYKWDNGDVENDADGTSVTTATLPDGAQVTLIYYREFKRQENGTDKQRVYILTISGAKSNVTITGGNLMQYQGGKPEYVATVLSGVTADGDGTDSFGYFGFKSGQWESHPKVVIQVQEDRTEYTNFNGDPKHNGANIRFQLQTGYENPFFIWEDRMSTEKLESSEGQAVIPWDQAPSTLEVGKIYGPLKEGDDPDSPEWYYIRIGNAPGTNGHKMCILTLSATAMKYMVRYMVGSTGDDFTNAPSEANDNVQGMPEFSTDDSNWDDELIPKDENGNPLPDGGGLEGRYLTRYDDNSGAFYDRQTTPVISVSDAQPTTKDGTKFFQHWVLVDKNEQVIKNPDNGEPIIIKPNGTITLADIAQYGVALNADIGTTDNNYYVLRLKGVWSDLPDEFKFYIRMVWTDENGKSHIMDLVQNVITSSTDSNLTDDDCLIVTVNTVTDTFKEWFKTHPFYAYAARNFIATSEREEDQFTDQNGVWEKYPDSFTVGSTEQGLNNPNAYYRVDVRDDGIVRYIVQREGTIILYLDEVNGSLPISKTVIGSNPGEDLFTYTITVKLLADDIARAKLPDGHPNYLTEESLKNMLPSGSYFGFAPSADMIDLRAFTGTDVQLSFKRFATSSAMEDWYSYATFTLYGGEATVLGVPQGSYTITEEATGTKYTVTVETDGKVIKNETTISGKVVEAGKTASAVKYTNEVKPAVAENTPFVSTEFTGDVPDGLEAIFSYLMELISGDSSQVDYTSEGTTLTIPFTQADGSSVFKNTGTPFGNITFKHTGTYQFLVTETLESFKGVEENTIVPSTSTRALTIEVENINGQLTVTKITVDGTVYTGITGDYALEKAVVPFVHSYMPIVPDAVRVVPTVYKKLHGRELLSASFDFELTLADNGETYNATNNAAGNGKPGAVTFPPIDFEAPGEYTVTVKETIPDDLGAADHIDYDNSEITIVYNVENVDGELQVTATYIDDKDTFENTAYVDAGIKFMKNYDLSKRPGGRWGTDTFTVTGTLISAPEDARVEYGEKTIAVNETAEIELTENDKANGKDLNLRFTNEGTYIFEVHEKNESIPGVSYDGSVYYVTAKVTAEGKSLAVSLSITKNGKAVTGNVVTFDNKYDPDHVDVTVNAHKLLLDATNNSVNLTAERFRFELVPNEPTVGSTLTAKNDANGNVSFSLKNLGEGVYKYTLREINDMETGVTYDPSEYAVTITVERKQGDSAVTYTIQYDGDAVPTFTNTLSDLNPDVTISKMQSVNGAASASPAMVKAGDQVTYTITVKNIGELTARAVTVTDAVPAGLVVTGINNGGQNNQGTITWTLDELPTESSQSVSFTVTVPAIATDQTWINTATVVWDGETTGKTATPVMLQATAVGALTLSKTIVAASGTQIDTGREFSFTVKLTDGDTPYSGSFSYEGGIVLDSGAIAPTGGTLVLDENGEATVSLKHGQTITIKEIPAGLSYVVTEATAAGYIPSISNGNGRIEANIATEVSATNTYDLASVTAAVPEITKTLTGRNLEPGEFTFVISCDPMDGVTLPGMVANDADGKVQFGHLTFTRPGIYRVTVREVIPVDALDNTKDGVIYDTHVVEFTYVVADNNLGGLTVTEPTVSSEGGENAKSFNNTFISSGQLIVSKQVTGNAGDLQAEFAFMVLLSDTSISGTYGDMAFSKGVATFTLKHGETKTASELPAGIRYSVHEQAANQGGYATTSSGETGVITANTTMTAIFVNAKDVVDIPQTGDNSHVETWLAMSLAALVSMICCLSIKRRKMGVRK